MTDERWERIAQIYQKAAELPSDERDQCVREACGSDAGLQAEVESLLAQADAAVLIDRPVWEAAAEILDDNPAVLPGSMVGPFRVESLIGEGGMGHVYRARDTTLQRDVALKVLPAVFARDPDRLARFSREAQVLASLNHPHIAAIYGFERSSGEPPVHALVLEFVEGPTLVDLIAQGPMRIDEALAIARQIAEALEAAHEQGIIHRDLKPANVKVRPDGTVKVLDFGLAKVFGLELNDVKSPRSPVGASPVMTAHGLVLGTATYTSPEQAKGRIADKRSDVWSFGCVLFEMLSGRRAFEGVDVAETLASIVRDAPDWSRLPADTPRTIVRLLKRCLEKDPRRRLPAIAAARFDIDDALTGDGDPADPRRTQATRWPRLLPWTIAAALAVGAVGGGFVAWRRALLAQPERPVIQFSIAPPENALLAGYVRPGSSTSQPQFAISPDGRHIAIVANTDGVDALWLRSLDTDDIRRLEGTEGAGQPFWSPDSRWVAFFAAGELKKLSLNGGPPIAICDTGEGRGGTWGRDNVIVFKSERPETETKSGDRGLQRVSAEGGPISVATTVDEANVISHTWPFFLPDGRRFLYVAVSSSRPGEIWIGSLDSTPPARIGTTESAAIYGAGHLFFWRDGSVLAQPFDPAAGRTVGDAFAAAGRIGRGAGGDMAFSVSATGTVVHAPAVQSSVTQLFWMDRTGNVVGTAGEPARNAAFALSPDGRWIAVTREGENSPRQRLWLIDTASNLGSQFTFGSSGSSLPVWSPDGSRVAFGRTEGQTGFDIFVKPVHGGAEERLLERSGTEIPSDWSRDGRYLLFTQVKARDLDVWALPLFGDRKPFAVIESPSQEEGATFSPDGRWIAYQSDESGEHEIYMQSFPSAGAKSRISPDGGRMPQWRADGREVFYFARDGSLMAAPIIPGAQVTAGNAQRLFPTEYNRRRGRRFFSVTPDGRRFLLPVFRDPAPATPLTVIVNWPASLAR